MARPTERKRHRLSQAVIDLRTALGKTQQEFAAYLKTALSTIARYETNRPPSGAILASLAATAQEIGRGDLALDFMSELGRELNLREIRGGHLSVDSSFVENPRGYLLLNIEGKKARRYVKAFYAVFQAFMTGTDEEKASAEGLLDDFHRAVQTARRPTGSGKEKGSEHVHPQT